MIKKMIPYGRQHIGDEDIQVVVDVLKSDWLTTGPAVEQFEQALAAYCGARYAIAVANGTAALHVAMLAAGIKTGDRVLTSANTFLASANCAEMVGATADFADIDQETLCVSLETLQQAWRDDVKALIPVDFAGYPCVTKKMADDIHERGAIIIEDASHAIGGSREGYRVGGIPWVDMTTFSFHPVKTITTGEGGAVLTNNRGLADRCRLLRNHGMQRVPDAGPWYYEMSELGYNYRMTDIQAALGLSQLKKLDSFVRRRQEIVDQYNAAFKNLDHVKLPISSSPTSDPRPPTSDLSPAWHLYVIMVDFVGLGKSRTQVMDELSGLGIGTQVHYIPVHLQPYYRNKYGYTDGKCPVAEAYYQSALSLPLYPAMSDSGVQHVTESVLSVLS